ncbi:sperm motility kinase-like [Carassius auratus]|uniref:non-specific serine/threonine protein kinase n=1 Tax=Carassius auratus TaxID=7957 RepID=A0A6P6J1X4_CARAU|nr:sperm motility kinase-like [Carassius auratus]XP_026052543.1 sperm motility kinase-like [Carassius auratus]
MSKFSDDVPPVLGYVTSDCRDEALQASVCSVADLSVGVPQSPLHKTFDCRDNVPQATTCATPDCSVYAPQTPSSQLQDDETTIIDINSHRYEIGCQLGKGGFGIVYAATRLNDGLQVAIKLASNKITKFISIDGYSGRLPLEVALQILANKGPRVEEIVQLLDWRLDPDCYFMVLERPVPCQSLFQYLKCYKGIMDEDFARVIMNQAIFAARMCCLRGVLHRDIKLENLLINPDTLEVKLIDFGCGAILTDGGYTSFTGTREYCPPEYHMTGQYHGEPATVWSLGILLFVILFRKYPKRRHLHKINDKNWTKAGLSKECCDLIRRCLQIDPKQRIELGKLSLHDWLMTADKENNNDTIMDINSCRYEIVCQLGDGGFGTVYAATRLDDGLQVAIKVVSSRNRKFISIDGCSKPLPLEVALQILADGDPRVEEIIQLLDWRVESDHYILVLERPVPFEELNWFLLQQMGTIQEDMARVIMRQATFAAQTCCRRGVFHQDIKLEKLLINPDTLKVKLTDFGCGDFLSCVGYTSFVGTREYCPPEYHMTGQYHGEPATVWSLGILLFLMLCGDFPNTPDLHMIDGHNWTKDGLSEECSDFICCCLQINPKERIELEKLSLHDWFMDC